jgi:Tfp pilus assembly protein PilO
MMVALLFIVGAFIFYFDFISPAYQDMEALKGKLVSEQNLLAQESTMVKQVQKNINSYNNATQAQSLISQFLPSTQDISGAVTQIYGIAGINNMSIQSISISPASIIPPTVSNSSSSVNIKSFGSITFSFSVSGSYESIKSFIYDIETNMRIFDIKSLSISPVQSAQGSSAPKDLFTCNLSIQTYYQPE